MKKHSIKNISILFLSALSFSGCKAHGALCREHTWMDWAVFEAPTCSKVGREAKECKVCGFREYRNLAINPDAHSFNDWEVTKEPTTSEVGNELRKCSLCNKIETREIDKLPIEYKEYVVADYYGGYYSSIVSWENGEDLKNQLHTLIRKDFTGLVYEGNWETNQMADQSLTNFDEVNVVYSQKDDKKKNTYGGAAGSKGWQREHAFCASLMTAYNTTDAVNIYSNGTSRATDFHNLFASYGAANGSRGNKNFGNHDKENAVSNSLAVDADTFADEKNYEPNDCDKGRLARAIFYMGVMYNEEETSSIPLTFKYQDENGKDKTKTVRIDAKYKPIQIVENYVDYSQITLTNFATKTDGYVQSLRDRYLKPYRDDTSAYISNSPDTNVLSLFGKAYADYRYEEGQFSIGNLSTLLDWNNKEVDRQEMWHNETVYSYVHKNDGANKGKKQGNRNPFVDYPELVEYVYGSKKELSGSLKYVRPSAETLYSNPKEFSNYALASYKNEYLVGETLSSSDYSIVRVNNDFTTQDIDFENTNQDYTFTESDIGEKTITLTTPTGNFSYVVNVKKDSGVGYCNYRFKISKSSFNSSTINKTAVQMLSYGGVTYKVSAEEDGIGIRTKDTYVQIGTSTAPAKILTIESTSDFVYEGKNKIHSVYLGLDTASGEDYKYKISVGNEVVKMGSFYYIGNGTGIVGIELLAPLSGVLKIELYEITKAVYISEIAVRVN